MSTIRFTSLVSPRSCLVFAPVFGLFLASAGVAEAACPTDVVDPVATLPADGATGVPTDAHFRIFRSLKACDDGTSLRLTKGDAVVPLYSDEGMVGRGFTKVVTGYPRTPLEPNTTYVLTASPAISSAPGPHASITFTTGAGVAPTPASAPTVTLDNVVWSAPVANGAATTATPNRVYRATVSVHVPVADLGGLAVVHVLASDDQGRSLSDLVSPVSTDGDIAASYPLGAGTDTTNETTFQWLGKASLCLTAIVEDSGGRFSAASPVACAAGTAGDVTAPSAAPVDPAVPLPGEGFDRSSCAFGGGGPRTETGLALGIGLVALGISTRRKRTRTRDQS